jgi:hypothetical protein
VRRRRRGRGGSVTVPVAGSESVSGHSLRCCALLQVWTRSHRGGRDVRGGSEDASRQEKTETVPCEETVAADPFPD